MVLFETVPRPPPRSRRPPPSRVSPITLERAERIAKSQPCARCGEYSFKQLRVRPAPDSQRDAVGTAWVVTRTCGICGAVEELGIDGDGDVVY